MFEGIKARLRERKKAKQVKDIQRQFIQAAKVIDAIDFAFKKKCVSRQKRRQFWNDFVNSEDFRQKFIKDMVRQF